MTDKSKPCKIVARLSASGRAGLGTVHLEQDGTKTELTRVTEIRADAEGNFEVKMWTEDFDAEVEISELTAAAILRSNAVKQLSFIGADDAGAIRALRAFLEHCEHPEFALPPGYTRSILVNGRTALDKICIELNRREEIPF